MCVQLFADDTNALVANKDPSLREFWHCLKLFCSASGLQIDHTAKPG